MKIKHLLLVGAIAVFSSCSSAYRIGQTPDDVYYSPAPVQEEYVTSDNQQDKDSYAYNNSSNNIEDLAIRRGINDPGFRNNFSFDLGSGYGYYPYDTYGSPFYNPYSYYNPYGYTGISFYPYYNSFNSFYSPYVNYYSPYYSSYYPGVYYVTKPGNAVSNFSGPRRYNLGVYNTNGATTGASSSSTNASSVPVRTFKPSNTTGSGNFVRRIFTPSDNNSRGNNNYNNNNNNFNNNSTPSRTFQPSTSSGNSGSSSGGGGGGSAPVRTFRH